MRLNALFVVAMLTVQSLSGCGDSSSPPSGTLPRGAGSGGGTWTVLVYMGADNDLEPFAVQDLAEMELVGTSPGVNVIVQIDTHSVPVNAATTAQRIRVDRQPAPGVQSQPLQVLGEIDMSDWHELVEFVDWGVASFPASRYALILWDHGGEWAGVVHDLSGAGDLMTPDELEQALQEIQARTGIGRLDLIGFDACLMAGLEVDAAIAPYARARVASEDVEPGDGWRYDAWLSRLATNPAMDAFALGREIATTYLASLAGTPDAGAATLSVVDLARVPAVEAAVDRLAATLAPHVSARIFGEVAPARRFSTEWGKQHPYQPAVSIDLLDFARFVRVFTSDPATRADCDAVIAALGAAVTFRANGSYRQSAGGVAIYFPAEASAIVPAYFNTAFAAANAWTRLILAYHIAIATDVTPPSVQVLSVTPQPPVATAAQPLQATLAPQAPDVHRMLASVLLRIGPDLLSVGTFEVTGATSLTWDGGLFVLTDGINANWLPLVPIGSGLPYSIVEAEWNATGVNVTLVVHVDSATGAAELAGAYFSPDGLLFGEFPLSPGDELAVHLPYFDSALGVWDAVVSASPVIVGPALAIVGRTVPGTYDLEIYAEDYAQNYGWATVGGIVVR